jgi:hypothetical protein
MKTKNKRITLYQLLIAVVGLTGCPPPEPEDTGDTGETAAIDADGDTFTVADGDCDDSDDTIYPGADEVCDGVDNNCNAMIDEGSIDASTWYLDADGDGFGTPLVSLEACIAPPDYVAEGSDCDDFDGTVHPGAVDIPGDGIDQNCDGIDAVLSSPCQLDIIGELSAAPGDEIDIVWEGGPLEQIVIRVFSGWGTVSYMQTFEDATSGSGSFTWELPADLDPSLDYHVSVASAQDGEGTQECWDYAVLDVQSNACVLEFTSELSGQPGDQIDITWDVAVGQVDQIQIRVYSGWSPMVNYLNTIVDASDGSYTWDLPESLDPSLDHWVYIESAASGIPNEQCWRYTPISVE